MTYSTIGVSADKEAFIKCRHRDVCNKMISGNTVDLQYIHLSVTQGGKETPLAVVLATGGRGDKSRKLIMAHQKG